MGSLQPLVLVATVVIGLGELLQIIGVGTHEWATWEVMNSEMTMGLFQTCTEDKCSDLDDESDPDDDLKAVRAMELLGLLIGLVAVGSSLVFLVLKMLSKPANKILVWVCLGACAAAAVFILIGVIIYGVNIFEDLKDVLNPDPELGYSFALCIVGAILMGIGGALMFFGGMSEAD